MVTIAKESRLVGIDEVSAKQQVPYIMTGYRLDYDIEGLIWSIFEVHN